jgi:hypothetical protein
MNGDREIQEHDEEFVDRKLQEIMQFYDAAQVFVTRQEPDGRTMAYSTGKGNFYARWGLIHEWVSRGGGMEDVPTEEPEQGDGEEPSEP